MLKSAFPKIILASGSYYITTVWPAIERYSIVVCQPIKRTNQIFCGYPDDNETYIITIQLGYVGDITSHWVKEFVIPVYTKVLKTPDSTGKFINSLRIKAFIWKNGGYDS